MNRRRTVTLHDIVIMDKAASSHYQHLHEDPSCVGKSQKSLSSKWTDGYHEIEYDPLLLAESLIILEEYDKNEEKEEKEEKEGTMSPIPVASLLTEAKEAQRVTRRVSVCNKEVKNIQIPNTERKKSAIEEHERVMDALRKCGLLA